MKSTDPKFYGSKKWKKERALYAKAHPFCERCLMAGIYKPVDIVHHREYLDTEKSKDAKLSLNFENLESLCMDCHNKEHFAGGKISPKRRYYFNEEGLVVRE